MTPARTAASLFAVVTIILAACAERNETPASADAIAERVITLSPHLAELMYAVGAGDALVGVSAYTDYPPSVADLPQIGDAFLIDHEQLAILRPDLLLAWASGTPAHVVDELRAMGYRVEAIQTRGLRDVGLAIERVGVLTGYSAEAQVVASNYRDSLDTLARLNSHSSPIDVFYQISAQPLYTINGEHFVGQLIDLCGGSNIFSNLGELAPLVSVESVLERNPEVIFAAGDVDDSVFDGWRRWDHLRANQSDNYYLLPAAQIGRPTARLAQAGKALCSALDEARQKRAHGHDQ